MRAGSRLSGHRDHLFHADVSGRNTAHHLGHHPNVVLTCSRRKKNAKSIIGPEGMRQILQRLHARGHRQIPTVCIGGINASNIPQVISEGPSEKALDGVAVVSAIVAADDPEAASRTLLRLVRQGKQRQDLTRQRHHPPGGGTRIGAQTARTWEEVVEAVPSVIRLVGALKPLSHNMTNLVVQNFAANVALAVGASPIMANYGEEAADLAKLGGALVVNMGTVTPEGILNYQKALRAYNAALRPVVFDPVG